MGKLMLVWVGILLLVAGIACQQVQYLRSVNATDIPALWNGAATFGDIDRDGRPDLLICGTDASKRSVTAVLRNSISGFRLQTYDSPLDPVTQCAIATGDWNNDSFLDVVLIGVRGDACDAVSNTGQEPATVFYLRGTSGFNRLTSIKTNPLYRGSAMNLGDINGDSRPDVLLTGANLNPCDPSAGNPPFFFTDLFKSDAASDAVFALQSGFITVDPIDYQVFGDSSVAVGDLNGDGAADLVMCGWQGRSVGDFLPRSVIAYRDTRGGVAEILYRVDNNAPIKQLGDCAVALFDYDIDGDLDIFITGSALTRGGSVGCQLLSNEHSDATPGLWVDVTSTRTNNITCMGNRPRIVVADFDRDGLTDFVMQGDEVLELGFVTSSTVLYMNKPVSRNEWFWERHNLINISLGSIALADIDGNEYPDLYVSGVQNTNSDPENMLFISTVNAAVTSLSSSFATITSFESTSVASLTGAGLLESTTAAASAQVTTGAASRAALQATTEASTSAALSSFASTSTSSTLAGSTTGAATVASYATSVASVLQTSVAAATSTLSTGQALRPPSITIHGLPLGINGVPVSDEAQFSGADTELKMGLTFRVRITKVEEEDENGYAWPDDNPCPTPSSYDSRVSAVRTSNDNPATLLYRSAQFCNGASLSLSFTQYLQAETISFAGQPLSVGAGEIKLQSAVRDWPFRSRSHRLRVQMQVTIVQTGNVLAERFFDRAGLPFIWQIEAEPGVYLEASLLRLGLIDGIPSPLNLSPSTDGALLFDVRLPWFAREGAWDPKFEALISGEYPKKKNQKGLKIGIPVAVGTCLLIVLVVGLVFFVKKHIDSKKVQTDVPLSKRNRMSTPPEEGGVL